MTVKRTLLMILICGFGPMLVTAALSRDWPDYSATTWLIYVTGLLVIALVFTAAERLVAWKRDQARDQHPAEQASPGHQPH